MDIIRRLFFRPFPPYVFNTIVAVSLLYMLYLDFIAFFANLWFGIGLLLLIVIVGIVFVKKSLTHWRFLLPGVLALLFFLVFPIVLTVVISFTNLNSLNIVTKERALDYLLSQKTVILGTQYDFELRKLGPDKYVLALESNKAKYLSEAFSGLNGAAVSQPAITVKATLIPENSTKGEVVPLPDEIKLLASLKNMVVVLPTNEKLQLLNLRIFSQLKPQYTLQAGGSLIDDKGKTYTADMASGFYQSEDGTQLSPGFIVSVGLTNYFTLFNRNEYVRPYVSIFLWTVVFAGTSVLISFLLGLVVAALLNWKKLRFSRTYTVLLFLPYAMPVTISILILQGLFNQNFGLINGWLNSLFHVNLPWFTDPALARTMMWGVNVWLIFPYFTLLAMGYLKSIPPAFYEVAAISRVPAVYYFFKITYPLLLKSMWPLLISSFAVNFNNLVLVLLLTQGEPNFPVTFPAGSTDLLASFAYRLSFSTTHQFFGLSAALSFIIFIIVAVLAAANIRIGMRKTAQ